VFWSVVFGLAIVWSRWYSLFIFLASLFIFAPGKPPDSFVSLTDIVIVIVFLKILLSPTGLRGFAIPLVDRKEEILLILLVALALASFLTVKVQGGNLAEGGKAVLRLGEYALAYFCCRRLLNDGLSVRRLEQALAILGIVFALLGMVQFALGPRLSAATFAWGPWWTSGFEPDQFRVYSVFGNPINFSVFCAALVPFSLERLRSLAGKSKVLFGTLFLASAVCLTLTGSRTGIICAVLGTLVSLRLRIRYWLVPITACVFLATVGITSNLSERLFLQTDESIENALGRIASAKDAIQLIIDHPLVGVGIGQYPEVVMKSFRGDVSAQEYESLTAEDTFLQFGAEMGLPGLCVLLGLEVLLLWRSARLLRGSEAGEGGLFGASVAFFAANFFASLTAASTMFFLVLLLALAKRQARGMFEVQSERAAYAT
jgi:O-antigen ligase